MHDFPGRKPTCSLIRCCSSSGVTLFRIIRSYNLYVWHKRDINTNTEFISISYSQVLIHHHIQYKHTGEHLRVSVTITTREYCTSNYNYVGYIRHFITQYCCTLYHNGRKPLDQRTTTLDLLSNRPILKSCIVLLGVRNR